MSYHEMGQLTPDQIYHRMCNKDVLKSKRGHRVANANPAGMAPDKDGYIQGRAEDGTPIKAKIRLGGKSLAARLNEAEEARLAAEKER